MNFHGGNIYDYKNIKYDFSSNINPLGVPESFKNALYNNIDMLSKYPDREYRELIKSLERYLGMSGFKIILGNGAVEVIHEIISLSEFDRVYTIVPTFSEYKRGALLSNKEFHGVECYNQDYTGVDIEYLLNEVRENSLVILCNPNNPTGYYINNEEMKEISEKLNKKNCDLLIDEAFIEFTPDYPNSSFLSNLCHCPNVTIIRAITKFFGMPGIRLGYGITGDLGLWERVRQSQDPWNINTAAVIAGCTVLEDMEYIEKSRKWIEEERADFYNNLSKIKDLKVIPSAANYHLLKIVKKGMDAFNLRDILINEGILIRVPTGFYPLTRGYFRLAVLDDKSNTAILKALNFVFRMVGNESQSKNTGFHRRTYTRKN